MDWKSSRIDALLEQALVEDKAPSDATTNVTIDPNLRGSGSILEMCIRDSINAEGGAYAGLDRFVARKKIVEDLEAQGLLAGIKDHTLNIGHCDRCTTIVAVSYTHLDVYKRQKQRTSLHMFR